MLRDARGRTLRERLIALGGLVVIVGAAVAVLLATGTLGNQGGGEGIEKVTFADTPQPSGEDLDVGVAVGNLAQDFEISDFDGERHRLSDFRGQAVYINFWATWCVPCQAELPDIDRLQKAYRDDVAVITVNRREPLDRARDYFAGVDTYDAGKGVSFTVDGIDPDDTLFDRYRALSMPASYFVSPDGVITQVHNGQMRYEDMEAAVAEALDG